MTILVKGSNFKPYEVLIDHGLIAKAGDILSDFLPQKRTLILTDDNVAPLWLDPLKASLGKAGILVSSLILEAGEHTKGWDGLKKLTDAMVEAKLDRKDQVIALGGGVIGDLTGLAASLYMRGIGFIQIPTTLLAQVDSSVGGKTAIDHPKGKNLIGTFWQPSIVLCALETLDTLPRRERLCGFAEVIKYGFLGDRDFLEWLGEFSHHILDNEPISLRHAVSHCVRMKADIVEKDERESAVRALLNLGHTFGHALEAETGFGEILLHGEAVAVGMALAIGFSLESGILSKEEAQRGLFLLEKCGLKTKMSQIRSEPFDAQKLVAHMKGDKKAESGSLTFILLESLGKAVISKNINELAVISFLNSPETAFDKTSNLT